MDCSASSCAFGSVAAAGAPGTGVSAMGMSCGLVSREKSVGRGSARAAAQQFVECAGLVERAQLVGAADVALADEDLRHRAPAGALDHLGPALRLVLEVDLGPLHALALEERAGARAEAAPAGRVHRHRRG